MRFPEFIEKLPMAELPAGMQAWLLQAPRHQVTFLRTEADAVVAEHTHAAQLEIPLQGSAEMNIGGEIKTFSPGQSFYVAAGVPHSAKVKGPYAAVIIFDSPNRYALKT
jgi:quercetin dioxygenase-like cupin family protein